MNMNILDDILDPQGESLDTVLNWVNERVKAIHKTDFTPEVMSTFAPIQLKEDFTHPLGAEASATWRRFFLTTLVADWASYDKPADRADFARLKYIMTSAYPYTRIWGCRLADGKFTPVGYTAWYPITKFLFNGVLGDKSEVNDRGLILPFRYADPENIRHAYIFNFSITEALRATDCSKKLMCAFKAEKCFLPDIGALMITVSPDGRKVAESSGFSSAGDITVQGETEVLYVRYPAP